MSNPFERYVQATFRQNEKLDNAKVPLMDTTLNALMPNFDNITKPNTGKSAGDLLVDAAASALKIPTIVGGVAVGAADLALSAAAKPLEGYQRIGNLVAPDLIPEPVNVGIGYIAKGLHDTIGYRPEEAKAFIDEKLFSDARKIQEKEYQSGYTAAEDKAFQDSWVNNYQAQVANLQKSGATEQQLKDFNTGFDKQYQEAATQRADKYQTSWDKPLSENIDIIGHGFNNLLENPSLALGGAIESAGYLLPSMAVSRGVMALEKAANVAKIGRVAAAEMAGKSIGELAITRSPFLAAAIGEGSVAGTTSLEQMRSQMPDGIARGKELLAAAAVAASTGTIGGVSGRLGSHVGLDDVDAIAAGRLAAGTAAMKLPALVKPVAAIAHEGGEEFAQTFGESIIPNVTMGKDPLEGLGQELPLGTMAGAIMGAGMNAPSLVSGGFSDISSGLGKAKDAVTSAASLKSFDTLSNPEHKNYNPAQAFNSQVKNLESNDEAVRTQAQATVDKLHADLNTSMAKTSEQISNIDTALKAMPPVAQMTDAQKLEVDALVKEQDRLTTKSSQLTDHFIGLVDAQVLAQEHRDAQQGTQFTEEQAKADIATLTQPQTSTVMTVGDTQIPVQVEGEPKVLADGIEKVIVNYTDEQGNPKKEVVPTSSLASVESTDTTTQQEALDRVQRHFSKYSNDDLDLLATSSVLSEEQRNSLRLLSKAKRELADSQSTDQVHDNIVNGYKGKTIQESHRGLNQYTDMVNTAVATKNEDLASLALDGLGAFAESHAGKAKAINEAFALVKDGTHKMVQVLRTKDGVWGLNTDTQTMLPVDQLKKVGGYNVHINSNKFGDIDQINTEAKLIESHFNALSGVAQSFVTGNSSPVDTSTVPTVDMPIVTEPSDTTAPVGNSVPEASVQSPIDTTDIKFDSGLTHNVPTNLLDQTNKLGDVANELLRVSSGTHTTEQRQQAEGLLNGITQLNPTVEVRVVKDLTQVTDSTISKGLDNGGHFDPKSNTVFINPYSSKWKGDVLDLVNHELIHTVTHESLKNGTAPKTSLDVLAEIKQTIGDMSVDEFEKFSRGVQDRLIYAFNQDTFDELLAVLRSETQVREEAKTVLGASFVQKLDAAFESIANYQRDNSNGTPNTRTTTASKPEVLSTEVPKAIPEGTTSLPTIPAGDGSNQDIGRDSHDIHGVGGQTEKPAEPVTTEEAKVTVLQSVTDEVAAEERKKPFNARNILKAYFKQSITKEGAVGANPLVTIANFIKGLGTLTQVSDWLNDRRKPTEKQLAQVGHFQKFHTEFAKSLQEVLNSKRGDGINPRENLAEYLKIPNTRNLDENVVTALALSAYSYLIKQGNKVMNTNEELEKLLRLKKGMTVPYHIAQMFRFAGQEMPIVVKALGADTSKALGLKVREDQDPTLQDRLNTSLGILALETMAKAELVVIDTLEGELLTTFLNDIEQVRKSGTYTIQDEYDLADELGDKAKIGKFTMVRPNAKMVEEGNTVFKGAVKGTLNTPQLVDGLPILQSPLVNELIEANKETKGFLSYLFGVDVGYTMPKMESPEKFTQQDIHGTDASVPSSQAELLTEAQKHSFTVRTNTVAVLAKLKEVGANSQFLKELLGIWIDDHVLSRTHVTERDSLQAKAQNDWTALLNGLEWAGATLDEQGQYQEFYDTQFVAQNQRQHLNSNMFSAQSSQIHRAMAALTGFSTTIDLTKDTELLDLFYQAVGEGLEGLDSELKASILAQAGSQQFFTVDKVHGKYYVTSLKEFLQTEVSQNAIKAMRALVETGSVTVDQQQHIADFVAKGKMGVQSLQSLIALAELSIAQDSKEQIFTTTIGFGSDGVNHGVSAANALTGVISDEMRLQTGIFPLAPKAQIQDMQTVYEKGIPDYYVDFGKVMATALTKVMDTFKGKIATDFVQGMTALFPKFEAITEGDELVDPLSMRKISKTWSIPFNYSAGKAALQRALARGFLEGIYKQMNSLANSALDIKEAVLSGKMTREDAKVKHIAIIEKTLVLEANLNKVLGNYGTSIKLEAPELLNDEAKGKFSNAVETLLMQGVIDLHGEAAWQATEQFAEKYLQVRNAYTEVEKASFTLFNIVRNQLITKKKLSRLTEDGKPLQTRESFYFDLTTKELAEVDAELAAMRPMFNTALSIPSESTNDANSTENPSGVSVRKQKMQREKASDSDRNVNANYGVSRQLGLTKEVEENAGVASSANAVQSIDAFVAAKVQGFMDALNVHDAAIFGLKDFLKGTKKQNEEHLKALTNYQLGLEHAKMLVKVYQGYKAFMATQEEALKTAEGKVRENIQSIINQATKEMDKLLKGEVIQREGKNLVIRGEVISKGGLIPKLQAAGLDIKSTASIEEAIGMFIDFAINQDVKKLGILKDTFGIHQFAGEGGMHQLTDDNRASIDEQKDLVNKAKAELQAELTGKPAPKESKPVSVFISFLRSFKDGIVPMAELLDHLKNRSDIQDAGARAAQGEVLKAITPLLDANTKVVYSVEDYEGYGYFDEETNTLHINASKEDGVRTSLAVHELLHAALSQRIKTLRNDIANKTGNNFEAVTALQKLDTLRINLLAKVTDPVLQDMLKNTDEFISNGLTDSRLQRAMGNVQVAREGRTISLKFRKFVEYVGQILGFRSKEISALAAFALDTAALLETIGSVTPVVASNNGERLFSTQSAEDLVNGQSSLDILQALPHSNTGAFNQQLDRLITEEIGQLYNQDDAAKARIDEIQTFTASDALNAGFSLSRKEQYVQQALQYAVAAYMKLHAGGANVGQLRRVYHAAKAKMDVTGKDFHEGDWTTATQQEKDAAKAKYDFMFDSTKEGYMDRFVSMALASESVSKILDIALPLTKPETQDKTWFETVSDWASYVMAWLTNKYVRLNPTLGASNQLSQLMDNLVKLDIHARQESVSFHQKAWNSIGIITTPLNSAWKETRGFLISDRVLANSRFLPLRALGAAITLRSEAAAKAIPKLILDMRNNQLPNTKLGEAANILLEASGVGSLRDAFDVLTRQTNLNAKNRQDISDNVKKAVMSWFKTELSKAQHKAITYGLLRTDAQALLEDYSVEDIVDMALHEGKLNAEIAKLKKEIAKNPNGNDMLNAAEQLGYYMVTRIGGEGLVKNATGIAIGLGTQYFTSVEQADPKLVSQLNTLVSMLAMTHVPNSDKAILAALYKTDAEGIHATIQLHNGLVNDSLKDFQANPLNMVKGWMPEVTNPYLEIKAANSMVERQQMEAEGWVLIDELKRDKHDKGSPKYLMKHNDIGYQRLVSGAVDLGSTARSGTEAISRTSPKYLGITQARYQNAARRAAIPNSSFDPSKQPRGLIAAYDTNGMALAYNYEMDNETRDAHLDRKHNIGDLLGTFGGLNYYKPEKAKQSNTVAEVLFEDYKANYSQNPNAYLKISHKSTDPKVVEMWRMLPQDFKQRATELYGKGNPIIIRNEAFNLAFGFKKFSVVSYAFDAVKAERERIKNGLVGTGKSPNAFQSGFVRLAEATRGNTAQADFAKAEHVTQEIVKAIKDFIVIRSGTTMMWNIFANVLMLMANGINPVTIVKDWVFAVTNVRAYQKLNSQLIQAQADLAGGKDPIALKQRIGALKAELKANVMNPYINAGLLSSIVEDVNIQQGEYTYASAFKQTVDEKTQWIPKPVKTAAAIATIAPSTKLYQFLATTTQLSDFVAKYTMSKHLQANGMNMDESLVEASKTFINYDLPTSQGLQYANDMGLFMFTKFFLRIQAVLFKLLGKKAGSVIAQHLLVENLTGAEGILSPLIFKHLLNNPLESSVFGLPSAFFSIGTVDAVTGVGGAF